MQDITLAERRCIGVSRAEFLTCVVGQEDTGT
jgi:hypothetical protein